MKTIDQYLLDAILLADSWQVPPPLLEEVLVQEAMRMADMDLEPTIDPLITTNPYLPLRF